MQIDARSWHARAYIWWYTAKYGHPPRQAQLCPYVRVVLLWIWPRYLFLSGPKTVRWITCAAILVVEQTWQLHRFGRNNFLHFWLLTLIMAGVMGSILCVMVITVRFLDKKHRAERFVESIESFGRIIQARSRSVHDRICPMVDFTGMQAETGSGEPQDE